MNSDCFASDFDGDGFLGKQDLERTVNCITRNELTTEEVDLVCDKVRNICTYFTRYDHL